MDWVTAHWKDILDVVAYTVAAASVVVKITPTPKDDTVLDKVIGVLAILGLNKKV